MGKEERHGEWVWNRPAELGWGCSERRATALGTQPQPVPKYTAPLLSSGHWKETRKPKGSWQNPREEEQPASWLWPGHKALQEKKDQWTPNLQKHFSKQREKSQPGGQQGEVTGDFSRAGGE